MFPCLVVFFTLDGVRDFCCCWFETASEADGQLQTGHFIAKSSQGTIRLVPPVTNVILTCCDLLRSLEPKILSSLILFIQFNERALIGWFGLHNGWYISTFVPPITAPPPPPPPPPAFLSKDTHLNVLNTIYVYLETEGQIDKQTGLMASPCRHRPHNWWCNNGGNGGSSKRR